MPVLPPLYQLAVTPTGSWRARVFNLPPYRAGQPPTLPFLRALAAQPWDRRDWQKGPEEKLTVLRLAGDDRASLARLLDQLRIHGIALASTIPGLAGAGRLSKR
jgi:hypothetical protein